MRVRIAHRKAASADSKAAATAPDSAPRPAALAFDAAPVAGDHDNAGAAAALTAGDHRNGTDDAGSKDESFFEARPWLDSDSEDDFYSVRGDFTPSRSNTPDHPRLVTSFSGRMPVDRSKPSLIQKKQRLLELLQEKQHYDDDDYSVTDVSSDLESSAVHDEEHMKTSHKGKKSNKSSRSGCFPSLFWKHSFTSSRKKRKAHNKDKVN